MSLSMSLSESVSYSIILSLTAESKWIYDCEYDYDF